MRIGNSFHLYASLTILFWSLAYVLTRMILRYFTPFSLGFLRYAAASCVLLAMVFAAKIKAPKRIDLKWFLMSGFFGFFLYMMAFNKGCETATASASSVVIATVPVITALLARLVFGEKLNGLQWVATAVEFVGVLVLMLLNQAFSLNTGLVWLLLAAVSLSVYNLLQRGLTKTYSGLQSAAFSIFSGTAMLAVFLPASVREAGNAPPVQLAYIAILGVFSSAVAYASWAQALKKAKRTSSVTNYMFATPFLTTLMGFVLAGEKPDLPTIAGGAVILAGMLIFYFGGMVHDRVFRSKRTI